MNLIRLVGWHFRRTEQCQCILALLLDFHFSQTHNPKNWLRDRKNQRSRWFCKCMLLFHSLDKRLSLAKPIDINIQMKLVGFFSLNKQTKKRKQNDATSYGPIWIFRWNNNSNFVNLSREEEEKKMNGWTVWCVCFWGAKRISYNMWRIIAKRDCKCCHCVVIL